MHEARSEDMTTEQVSHPTHSDGRQSQIEESQNDPRRVFLRHWLSTNEVELRTALRPLGSTIAATCGLSPIEATLDLMVEVTRIALGQAYLNYDLTYSSPHLWLLKIAHNVLHRWREEAQKQSRRLVMQGDSFLNQDQLPAQETGAQRSDPSGIVINRLWAQQQLARLSKEDQDIIQFQVVEQLSYEEIAVLLQITAGAARVRYHRAIKRLRQLDQDDSNKTIPEIVSPRLAQTGRYHSLSGEADE